MWQSSQRTASGLVSHKMRDVDSSAPRARLPPRALPDSVRRQMGLPQREGAPPARRNWEVPPAITTKEALFGENARCVQMQAGCRQEDNNRCVRKVGAIVEVNRVPKNQPRSRGTKAKAGSYASPYDAELGGGVGRMERMPS